MVIISNASSHICVCLLLLLCRALLLMFFFCPVVQAIALAQNRKSLEALVVAFRTCLHFGSHVREGWRDVCGSLLSLFCVVFPFFSVVSECRCLCVRPLDDCGVLFIQVLELVLRIHRLRLLPPDLLLHEDVELSESQRLVVPRGFSVPFRSFGSYCERL